MCAKGWGETREKAQIGNRLITTMARDVKAKSKVLHGSGPKGKKWG
jgi:hypothetical protein